MHAPCMSFLSRRDALVLLETPSSAHLIGRRPGAVRLSGVENPPWPFKLQAFRQTTVLLRGTDRHRTGMPSCVSPEVSK